MTGAQDLAHSDEIMENRTRVAPGRPQGQRARRSMTVSEQSESGAWAEAADVGAHVSRDRSLSAIADGI